MESGLVFKIGTVVKTFQQIDRQTAKANLFRILVDRYIEILDINAT